MKKYINKLVLLLFSSFLFSTNIYANDEDYFIFTVEGSDFTIGTYLDDYYNVECDSGLGFMEEYLQDDYTCVYDDGGYHTITIIPNTFRYMLIGSTANAEKVAKERAIVSLFPTKCSSIASIIGVNSGAII